MRLNSVITCSVDWTDFTKTNQKLDVVDSDDLNSIANKPPRDDLL